MQRQAGTRGAEIILQSIFVMWMQQKVRQEVALINRSLEISLAYSLNMVIIFFALILDI